MILGNGGVKTTRTYEEDPKLMGYVVDLQAFDKALTEAQKNGTVLIEKNMITNIESANLTNKKNPKNTSKHGDGCGIYARICLRASENKFSPPSPSSLYAIARDTAMLREKNHGTSCLKTLIKYSLSHPSPKGKG